jgi:ABC-type lipoprotein export system ATPase subunit
MKNRRNREEEKTVMLIGSTGSCKSTLLDGIVNYVMGVSFDDPFRFTLVNLEDDKQRKTGNHVRSYLRSISSVY